MWLPPLLCYIFSLILSLIGIQFHINLFKYPLYLLVSLTLAVFIPISIIFLLPIDYVSHNSPESVVWFNLPDDVILYLWKSNYWITFLLTWLILPILQEFFRSGHFNKLSKFKDALKRNLKFQFVVLGVSILGIIYLLFEVGLTLLNLKLMVIAISHIYSLILALWLMAHGLVNIPRLKWIEGNVLQNLNHHYIQVPKLVDILEDTKITFKEEILKVIVLAKNYTSDSQLDFRFRDWILQLDSKIPFELKESMERQYLNDTSSSITRDQLTINYMTKLTSNFNQNLYKVSAYQSEFDSLVDKIVKLEDILNAKTTSNIEERNQLHFRVHNYKYLLSPKLNFIYFYYVRPIASRVTSIILYIASFAIIQSEFFHSTKLSLINLLVYSTGIHNHNSLQLVVTSVIFSYMLFASLNSLTKLKIFNMYHLVAHNSDPVSASFYATYIARLTIPLSYNFITLFYSRESIFEDWFGKSIHLTGLFNILNNWLPRLVLVPVVLTIFNVYEKLKKRFGLTSDYDSWILFDEEEEDQENLLSRRKDLILVESKRIVARELNKRNRVDDLRPFNLANAANMNYENNLRSFNNSLATDPEPTRIDSYHDFDINDSDADDSNVNSQLDYLNRSIISTDGINGVWGKLGGVFNNWRTNVTGRFNTTSPQYRDEPIDNFNYDDDVQENVIL